MASTGEIYSALTPLGFENTGNICYGTWKGYAIALHLQQYKIYYTHVATRVERPSSALRKAIRRAIKGHGLRMLGGDMGRGMKREIIFSHSFPKNADPAAYYAQQLDLIVSTLRENGISPADTCDISGSAHPDSLCLIAKSLTVSYQPVCAAVVKNENHQAQEQVERNELSGNYVTGFIGALLGMLVGLIPNLLTIIYAESIYAILFALVPICAMFGYKLFRGKMNTASIVIGIVLSLIGVLLIPYLETVFYLVRDEGFALGEALSLTARFFTDPANLSDPEISGPLGKELLQLVLFMALGIFVSWRLMRSKTNSSVMAESEAQLASLRPNPAYSTDPTAQDE